MKIRISAVLIICMLLFESCAVISKNDYTAITDLREKYEKASAATVTPSATVLPSSDISGQTSQIEDEDKNKGASAHNNPISVSENITAVPDEQKDDDPAKEDNTSVPLTDNPEDAKTDPSNVENINSDNGSDTDNDLNSDNTSDTGTSGKTDNDNASGKTEAGSGSDKKEEIDSEKKTTSENTDKSYRKEEDIIIPASKLDEYIADFDKLAPSSVMSFSELVGDNGNYDLPTGFPKAGTYKIIVDLYHQVVMVFSKDDNGEYTVPVRYMLCSSGLSSSPTRTGVFTLRSYRVRFGLFNNTSVYAQYWSLIDGRMYFHSILYSERDAATYTSSFNKLGSKNSHGCVRLSVPDARWIWYNAAPGTTVVVRKGSSDDVVTAKIKELLTLDKMPSERPASLKGDKIPYTDNWTIEDVPHEVEFIQGTQNNS